MSAVIVRRPSTDQGTFGQFFLNGMHFSYTGELPWLNNERNVSCIPPGEYTLKPHTSPHFGKCFIIVDVQGRSFILIHKGNWCGNRAKGFRSDVLGCIIVGQRLGTLAGQAAVLASGTAFNRLLRTITMPIPLTILESSSWNS
ncbi:DUF5675 family protein [Gynuella sp.]|uniref:DUF5675 family protein n=1 Tax=Gynuella sp. TaxID=2969146 RepID=UPI003D0F1624